MFFESQWKGKKKWVKTSFGFECLFLAHYKLICSEVFQFNPRAVEVITPELGSSNIR